MGFIGRQPTPAPLTSSDLADGIVSKAKIANDAVDNTKLDLTDNYSFTGTITGAGQSLRPTSHPLIINGNMELAQRGTSFSDVANGAYTMDRFRTSVDDDGAVTITQEGLTTGNAFNNGFRKALKCDVTTADTSATSTQKFWLQYNIEAQDCQVLKFGSSNAEKITLSFWVKATKTGTNVVRMYVYDSDRSCSQSYTVSSSDTWEKKVLNFPAETHSSGDIDVNNEGGIQISWALMAGASFQSGTLATTWGTNTSANDFVGQVNNLDSTSNNFHITGVQLEVGEFTSSTIPAFQHESYAENLRRCQRYFEICEGGKQFYNSSSHQPRVNVDFREVKRATPTIANISTAENCANQIQYAVGSIDDKLCARVNAVNAFVTGEKFFYGKFSADAEV